MISFKIGSLTFWSIALNASYFFPKRGRLSYYLLISPCLIHLEHLFLKYKKNHIKTIYPHAIENKYHIKIVIQAHQDSIPRYITHFQ
jgi:hypothetical protein